MEFLQTSGYCDADKKIFLQTLQAARAMKGAGSGDKGEV